jgi:hypothetical protein
VAHIGGAPTPDKAAAVGNAAPEAPEAVTDDGSSTLVPDTTVVVSIGPSVGASSPRPQMGATSASVVDGDDIVEEPEVVHVHPLLRAPGGLSLDEAMGTAHWALN